MVVTLRRYITVVIMSHLNEKVTNYNFRTHIVFQLFLKFNKNHFRNEIDHLQSAKIIMANVLIFSILENFQVSKIFSSIQKEC